MRISYQHPFSSAWRHMSELLFRPFNLGLWFALGFTAWLAGLVGGGNTNAPDMRWNERVTPETNINWSDWSDAAWAQGRELATDTRLFALMATLAILALALVVLLTWLGSRGQFMFLDNLVHRRAEVGRPWGDYAHEGNSLFLWQLVYGVVTLVTVGGMILAGTLLVVGLGAAGFPTFPSLPVFIGLGMLFFVVTVTLAYAEFFLLHAVVPIMYHHRIGAMAAWSRFLAIFRRHPGVWVLFGLCQLMLTVTAVLGFLLAGLLTCCVGWILLVIPYLGTVVTLPLPVLARYLDLEFLGQFGPAYRILESPAPSDELDGDGTVIGPTDVGQDARGAEPGRQDT